MQHRRAQAARAARGLAWLAAVALVSLGGAGLAVSADHVPGDATRPELTWTADVQFRARIAATEPDFSALDRDVNALGDTARTALVDLVARRDDLLSLDLSRGDALVASIETRAARLSAAVVAISAAYPDSRIGEASRATLASAQSAVEATRPLAGEWRTLADGALPAIRLAGVLQQHDAQVFAAIQQAHAGQFVAAVATLAAAGAFLDKARQTRDGLESRADVSTLTAWIDRAAAYDMALTALYRGLELSGGRITAAVDQLAAKVSAAQAQLPPDTRALVVIMGDIARAGLYQAAIAIEQARGDLAEAAAALH